MNIRQCSHCEQYVEQSDMERIHGRYYCYVCFDFCKGCNRPVFHETDNHTPYCPICERKQEKDAE